MANRLTFFCCQLNEGEAIIHVFSGGTCTGCTGLVHCLVLPVLLSPVMSYYTPWMKRMGWVRRKVGMEEQEKKGGGREMQSTEEERILRRLPSVSV